MPNTSANPPMPPTPPAMGPLPAVAGCDCHICRPDTAYDTSERRTIETVLVHGWQVLLISDAASCECPDHGEHANAETSDEDPAFAYTVGLGHRVGHPDLLISGLSPQVMHHALNAVATRVMNGLRLHPGDVLEDVLVGVPVVVETASNLGLDGTVTYSAWFHRRSPEALVLVWPTKSGIFPWQPGAPPELEQRQPSLWREAFPHVGAAEPNPSWDFPAPAETMAFSCTHVVHRGDAVLYVARQSDDERGEDWTIHCGGDHHTVDEITVTHLAHLVRSAPSIRALSGLELDHEAWRDSVDAPWQVSQLP